LRDCQRSRLNAARSTNRLPIDAAACRRDTSPGPVETKENSALAVRHTKRRYSIAAKCAAEPLPQSWKFGKRKRRSTIAKQIRQNGTRGYPRRHGGKSGPELYLSGLTKVLEKYVGPIIDDALRGALIYSDDLARTCRGEGKNEISGGQVLYGHSARKRKRDLNIGREIAHYLYKIVMRLR
jgi:hypothetical protein